MARNVEMLINALDYIEANIAGDFTVEDIASKCYVSVSGLQKTFKYVFHMTVKEYILRRRFTCAARDLLSTEESILDIALKYGYASHESFTRGFKKVWGITPLEYRKTRHFTGHTPRLAAKDINIMEVDAMSRTKYDLTELYDVLQERKDKAYVCADLGHLMWINDNLGREAGDAALLEMMRTIEAECNEDDIFLRIGGDEFVVFTNSEDTAHANELVENVGRHGKKSIKLGKTEIPVKIHIGSFLGFPDDAKTSISGLSNAIDDRMRMIKEV